MKYAKTIAVAALAVAALAGCASHHPAIVNGVNGNAAPASVPPTVVSAAGVLNADGYQVDPATIITASQALINLGIADRASGTRGSDAEQVLIFTGHPDKSVPACKQTAVCTPAGMASELRSQDPGTRVSVSGLVLRTTGTIATFRKDGLPV